MKKLLALLIIGVFMFAAPGVMQADQNSSGQSSVDWGQETENFGTDAFMYLKGVAVYPVHALDSAVRTMLFMDKE